MRIHPLIVYVACVAVLVSTAASQPQDGGHDATHTTDHSHHPDHTADPDHHTAAPWWEHTLTPQERERRLRKSALAASTPLHISSTDWWWVPLVLVVTFTVFMLSTVKMKKLHGKSPRAFMMRWFPCETLYETLAGATLHHYHEQRDAEIGHQFLTFVGCALLTVDWVTNDNRDSRIAVVVLTTVQIVLLFFSSLLDCVLLARGYVRPVRSINTKLRWAHCTYQVVLFCTDAIGGGFSLSLPIDCFMWAIIHYSYEGIGLALEGLNIIGMSMFAIVALVVAQCLTSPFAAEGWTLAFGLSSLALSSLSIGAAVIWKMCNLTADQHDSAAADHHDDHLSDMLVDDVEHAAHHSGGSHSGAFGSDHSSGELRQRAIDEHLRPSRARRASRRMAAGLPVDGPDEQSMDTIHLRPDDDTSATTTGAAPESAPHA